MARQIQIDVEHAVLIKTASTPYSLKYLFRSTGEPEQIYLFAQARQEDLVRDCDPGPLRELLAKTYTRDEWAALPRTASLSLFSTLAFAGAASMKDALFMSNLHDEREGHVLYVGCEDCMGRPIDAEVVVELRFNDR